MIDDNDKNYVEPENENPVMGGMLRELNRAGEGDDELFVTALMGRINSFCDEWRFLSCSGMKWIAAVIVAMIPVVIALQFVFAETPYNAYFKNLSILIPFIAALAYGALVFTFSVQKLFQHSSMYDSFFCGDYGELEKLEAKLIFSTHISNLVSVAMTIMGIFSYSMFEHVYYSEWGIIRFTVAVLSIQGAYVLFFTRSWRSLKSFDLLRAFSGVRKVTTALYISKAMTQVLIVTVFITAFIIADESYLFALAGVLALMFCLTLEVILLRVVFSRLRNKTNRITATAQFLNLSARNSFAVLCMIIALYCGDSFVEYSEIQADIERMSQQAAVVKSHADSDPA